MKLTMKHGHPRCVSFWHITAKALFRDATNLQYENNILEI